MKSLFHASALLYVTKLSDIFRYVLQSDKRGLVTLGEELTFIRSFMHVMEVRFGGKLACSIDVPEEAHKRMLPVLSLLLLVENVTVHNQIDSDHRMDICIRMSGCDWLEVSNPVFPKLVAPDTSGIGLQNLRSRFELMLKMEICVESVGEFFRVFLPLK